MRGAKAVVECLKEQGVDTIFGYPGGMNLPLYDALYDERNIRQIVTSHEQCAAHAADGYARATGKVGVCLATSGPGATNLVTGIATAFMDSIPMVAITGQVDTGLLGRDAFQETDILGITMPVTKHNFKVKDAAKLIPTLREAFDIARSGRPGPVLVDIPRDLFFADVKYESCIYEEKTPGKPDADFLICAAEAAEAIRQARKPVIIAGGGVIYAGASKELAALAEHYGIPVVQTLMGLGSLPHSHPLCVGFAGMHGHKAANHAIAESDVVIALGSRFGDRQTGNVVKYMKGTTFIHVDIDPAEIDKNIPSSIGLAGDMKTILHLLMKPESLHHTEEWLKSIRQWRTKYAYDYDAGDLSVPWAMHHVALATAGKPYSFATDVGQHQMWAALHLRIEEPRSWLTSGGLGTMGFGLPAAMGAQAAYGRSRRVIHIAGDGGMRMTGNELYTIARLKLPVISLVMDNCALGMIRQLQKVMYKERYIACELAHPMDFVAYAKSFGIEAEAVQTQEEFIRAFSRAMQANEPRVIVLKLAKSFVEPMIKGGARLNEFVEFK
ncbi:biosynthetic-type acetolactate synthase large subunit [Selenomonas sputigena]|uniref:biosynthetic-type acetolactate synthase large subunit n=1 Tax=Selenomonas sputigena TaxID=69823 RepID=UPI0022349042|nr:biosynthetic-type acetolactate synthase large subunit [Selenomonas sputigena]UZE46374.1 biosynthetic-type acetolactate synthase large subunit [Selenomonas sputigena]